MDYGTHPLDLYRVWNVKAKNYVSGLTGTRNAVRIAFHDWLCNEFCNGYNPKEMKSELKPWFDKQHDAVKEFEEVARKYFAARRNYRIVRVQVSIGQDMSGNMTAVVI